jgi:Zn-finger nucleic acid-binding protein
MDMEDSMANCSNCSAPLPPNSALCEYCGSRNDIDLAGIHYHTTHELESPRDCPRCSVALKTIDLGLGGKFLIERCDQCLGLFFDPGELEALLEATVSNVFVINQAQLNSINNSRRSAEYGVSYLKCPACSRIMNRVNFGTKSGVIVDRCQDDGVWLDGGELRHLFEWMKAGGKLLDQQRREEQKKEASLQGRKEREQSGRSSLGATAPGSDDFEDYGSILKRQDPDLFDLVRSAVNFFLR